MQLNRRIPRTLEAFAEAIIRELNIFDAWCAEREVDAIRAAAGFGPPLVVSLLSLEKAVADEFGGAFEVLAKVVRDVFQRTRARMNGDTAPNPWSPTEWIKIRASPARIATLIVDTLLDAVYNCGLRGEAQSVAVIFRVFTSSAEPIWEMTRKWLRDGMHTRLGGYSAVGIGSIPGGSLAEEFFIEDNELPVLDPDFWAEGFVLREFDSLDDEGRGYGQSLRTVPVFLAHVAELVLGAGQALGLLRALGAGEDVYDQEYLRWIGQWQSFAQITRPIQYAIENTGANISSTALSPEVLSNLVYDEIARHCRATQATLTKVLVDECDFPYHLQAVEDLFLMRRGDTMSHFADILFARVR